MSVQYQSIGWNRQKRMYDLTLAAGILGYLLAFVGLGSADHRLVWAFEISTPEIFSKNRLAGIDSGELVHRISGVLPDGAGQQARVPGKRRAFHAIAIESNSGSDYAGGIYCFHPRFIQE